MNEELTKTETVDFDEMYELLKNENKILKAKDKKRIEKLPKNYLYFLKKLENPTINFDLVSPGEVINGKIIEINSRDIVIDIEYKDNVYVDKKTVDQNMLDSINVGDLMDVMIMEIVDNPYCIKGSISELMRINISNVVKEHYKDNKHFFATVLDSKPAGYNLKLEIEGQIADAFMPNTLAGVNKLVDQTSIVGQRFEVMIETLEQDKGVYVVSRKKYLESLVPERIKLLRKEDKNKVYTGFITGTTPFGAFIEFEEYLTCMIYRNNVNEEWRDDENWNRLKPGMMIDFYIKEITKKFKIIATQVLRDSLWDTIKVDDEIRGKVIALKPFGALIQLDEETNGLIQNTYLTKNKIILHLGQEIDVRVTSIMRDERKISLSLK